LGKLEPAEIIALGKQYDPISLVTMATSGALQSALEGLIVEDIGSTGDETIVEAEKLSAEETVEDIV
jgi:hypothetical protein